MKTRLSQLSDIEIETLSNDIERKKPWRTLDYALLYFLRRWTLTIGSSYALVALPISPLVKIALFFLTVAVDVVFVPRFAWDLRQPFERQLSLLKTRYIVARHGFTKVAAGIVLFSAFSAVLLYFSRSGAMSAENIGYLAFASTFSALLWTSIWVPKYKIAFHIQLTVQKKKPHILGTPIFNFKNHPFLGIIPELNPYFMNAFTSFCLCFLHSTLVLGILTFILFHKLTNPYLATPFINEAFVVASSAFILLLSFCIFGQMPWWIRLHKTFDLRKE